MVYNFIEKKLREKETKYAQTNIWISSFFCIKDLTPLKLFNLSTHPFLPPQINMSMVFKLIKDTFIPQHCFISWSMYFLVHTFGKLRRYEQIGDIPHIKTRSVGGPYLFHWFHCVLLRENLFKRFVWYSHLSIWFFSTSPWILFVYSYFVFVLSFLLRISFTSYLSLAHYNWHFI